MTAHIPGLVQALQ